MPKRCVSPKAVAGRRSSVTTQETETARLTRERDEARQRERATVESLRAIASSPHNAQPVFEAIVNSGLKLFPDALISIAVPVGDQVTAAAIGEPDPGRPKSWRRRFPFPQSKQASTALKEQRSDYHGGRGCSMNSESCALPASVCQDNEGVAERYE